MKRLVVNFVLFSELRFLNALDCNGEIKMRKPII